MPVKETEVRREYTAEETTSYEAYISAVAEHNIVCARPGATTRDKMDAAFAIDRAWKRFCEAANLEMGRDVRSAFDARAIERLKVDAAEQIEAIRTAWSMLFAVDAMNAIQHLPLDDGMADAVNVSCLLLLQAQHTLRAALRKADAA